MTAHRRSRKRLSCQFRSGYTLVEMLVAITAGVVVMTVAAGLLATLMRLEDHSQRRFSERAAVMRLAEQFRRDAHAAIEASAVEPVGNEPAGGAAWELKLGDDHRVEYRIDRQGLLRTEHRGDRTTRQEWYAFAAPVQAAIDLPSSEERLIRLRLEGLSKPGADAPLPPMVIAARLGLDHRFAQAEEQEP
jgi:prepilin-type N-terminal cleavage/methylation domain-containing protein